MVGIYTRTTAVLSLAAAVAALVGAVAGPTWLGGLGGLGLILVSAWTVFYARRRPELVREAEREQQDRRRRRAAPRV